MFFRSWDVVLGYDVGKGLRPLAGSDPVRLRTMAQWLTERMGNAANWPRDPDQAIAAIDALLERNLIDPPVLGGTMPQVASEPTPAPAPAPVTSPAPSAPTPAGTNTQSPPRPRGSYRRSSPRASRSPPGHFQTAHTETPTPPRAAPIAPRFCGEASCGSWCATKDIPAIVMAGPLCRPSIFAKGTRVIRRNTEQVIERSQLNTLVLNQKAQVLQMRITVSDNHIE